MAKTRRAYCVKCKEKRDMTECELVEMKNGRNAVKGKCPECGCGMYSILSVADAKAFGESE